MDIKNDFVWSLQKSSGELFFYVSFVTNRNLIKRFAMAAFFKTKIHYPRIKAKHCRPFFQGGHEQNEKRVKSILDQPLGKMA